MDMLRGSYILLGIEPVGTGLICVQGKALTPLLSLAYKPAFFLQAV